MAAARHGCTARHDLHLCEEKVVRDKRPYRVLEFDCIQLGLDVANIQHKRQEEVEKGVKMKLISRRVPPCFFLSFSLSIYTRVCVCVYGRETKQP